MKNTLEEQKRRTIDIISQIDKTFVIKESILEQDTGEWKTPNKLGIHPKTNNIENSAAVNISDVDDAIGEFVLNCLESGMKNDEIKSMILASIDDALNANDDNEGGRLFPQGDENDEYGEQYDKNMAPGFKPETEMKEWSDGYDDHNFDHTHQSIEDFFIMPEHLSTGDQIAFLDYAIGRLKEKLNELGGQQDDEDVKGSEYARDNPQRFQ